MIPAGRYPLISSRDAVQGSTTEKTRCSRIRRAMSCVYCEPKSRMTMDWGSMDYSLRVYADIQEKAFGVRPSAFGLERRGGNYGNWPIAECRSLKAGCSVIAQRLYRIEPSRSGCGI